MKKPFYDYQIVKVSDIIPYANNPRTHSKDQIAQIEASINEFGFTNPILIDDRNNLIAGHGRLSAAVKLGMKQVPAIILGDISETKRKALILADNKIALNSGWDNELLKMELEELQEMDFDLSLTGFLDDEISDLLENVNETELPELSADDKLPFQEMTFTLHDDQVEIVKRAMNVAKAMGEYQTLNENSNGNALARVCEIFLMKTGN